MIASGDVRGAAILEVVSNALTLKRKTGRRSVAVTKELCVEIFARWHVAGVLSDDDEKGEDLLFECTR